MSISSKAIKLLLAVLFLAGSASAQVVTGGSGGGLINPVLINHSNDAFNRTASGLGANWTAYLNNLNVTPGAVIGTAAGQISTAAYTGVTTNPTQTVRVSIGTLNGATDFPGAAVRISGTIGTSVSYYTCNENTTTLSLQKVTGRGNGGGGAVTTLASTAVTGVAGDFITLSVVGNTLSCTRNIASNPALQVNDSASPLTTGLPGVSIFGVVATIASFDLVNAGAPAGATENIVFDGDSIIAANGNGSNGTDPATSFLQLSNPTAYVTNLGVSAKCVGVACAAASAGNIESMLTTGTSVVDTLFVPGIKNICVLWGGTNDIANGSRTPAQAYADITTYVANRHSAGWKVIVVPALSRSTTGFFAAIDVKEAILTSLIQANTAGADAVAVLPPSLIAAGSSQNTTLFNTDQIHPTEITHAYILSRVFSGLLSQF